MKANQDNFANLDSGIFNRNPYPDISEDVQQTLSRSYAYDAGNGINRRILCDSDGRLLVSTSASTSAAANNSQITVSLVSVQLVAANGSRKYLAIENLGANPIYIVLGSVALVATGFQIPSGGIWIEDRYLGAINAIATIAGNDVRIQEVS